jgi:hypothetical protein
MTVSILSILFSIWSPTSALAEDTSLQEANALEACLFENHFSEQNCYDIPYYVCMGTQMTVAPNPLLARERCLHHEAEIWESVLMKTCQEIRALKLPSEPTEPLRPLKQTKDWSPLIEYLNEDFKQQSHFYAKLRGENTRLKATQLLNFLNQYKENARFEVIK